MSKQTIIRHVRELIAALDRRKPRTGHADEPAIAAKSAALRLRALARLDEVEREDSRLREPPA